MYSSIKKMINAALRLPVRLWVDQRGSSIVEFALVLPILSIIVVGIVDIGRAIHYHQALTEGVRAGARYLTRVADPCSSAAMEGAVGLLVTRSIDWSNPPLFPDWPSSYAAANASTTFQATRVGCAGNPSALSGTTITMEVRYDYASTIGWFDYTLRAGHEERYIGL